MLRSVTSLIYSNLKAFESHGIRSFWPVVFDRCNSLITECRGGLSRAQPDGRANSMALAWRQREGPKTRGSPRLR
eukprot:385709-Amphidinium_carterae.1